MNQADVLSVAKAVNTATKEIILIVVPGPNGNLIPQFVLIVVQKLKYHFVQVVTAQYIAVIVMQIKKDNSKKNPLPW